MLSFLYRNKEYKLRDAETIKTFERFIEAQHIESEVVAEIAVSTRANKNSKRIDSFTSSTDTPTSSVKLNITADSAPAIFTAIAEKDILFSHREESDGSISIIINKTQRPVTSLSGSQGDHITAYATLLQMLCSAIDGTNMDEAPDILCNSAKCFINDATKIKVFDTWFLKRRTEIKNKIFPREKRKIVTASLRKTKILKPEEVEHLKNSIKRSDRILFAQLSEEVGEKLLKDINKDDLTVLPRLSSVERDSAEGARVKGAMERLRILNRFLRFKDMIEHASPKEYEQLSKDFQSDCEDIIKSTNLAIKMEETFNKHFMDALSALYKKDKRGMSLSNINNHIDKIKAMELNVSEIGRLFNSLFDFKEANIEGAEEHIGDIKDGAIINSKVIFNNLEDVFYKVTARHVNFMFAAFKYLRLISESDKESLVKVFLEYILHTPSRNKKDNYQGWSNYERAVNSKKLDKDMVYGRIKSLLNFLPEKTRKREKLIEVEEPKLKRKKLK